MTTSQLGSQVTQQFVRRKASVTTEHRQPQPPKPNETMKEWAKRQTVRNEDAVNTVTNRVEKRRTKSKLAKASRRRNRGK